MSSEYNPSVLERKAPASAVDWLLTPEFLFRVGLVLLAGLYLRTITFDFVYDDLTIPLNPLIQSWHGVVDAFKTDIFGAGGQAGSSYYRPLSVAMVVSVARLTTGTPAWFHVVSLLLTLVLYCLCYLFSRLFFEDDAMAAVTTLLFAVHPTKVETVAWIGSALCDGQAAIYFFAVLACYLKWWKTRRSAWLAGSVVFFLAAMFTKETMIVLPVLVATHCWMRSARGSKLRETAAALAPYLLVGALYALARHAMLKPLPKSSIAIAPTFTMANLWSAPSAFWWYVGQFLFPLKLAMLHDWSEVSHPSLQRFVLPLLGLLILGVGFCAAWRRTRSWRGAFLAAWFLLTLAPVIVFAPRLTMHDRYLQLPSYALCAAIAFPLVAVGRRSRQHLRVALGIGAVLVILGVAQSWRETGYWDNNVSLWERAVQVAPHRVNARLELARLYAVDDLPAALRVLDDGLRLVPDSPGLWRTRGLLLFNAESYEEARTSLMKALAASKRFEAEGSSEPADVKYGRATSNFFLGEIEIAEGNPGAADHWLRAALSIAPENADYQRVMLANLRKQGRTEEAEQYEKQLEAENSAAAEKRGSAGH